MTRLDCIIEDFKAADDELRMELLLEYAALLPPLPAAYCTLRDAGLNFVEECQSPVFLMVDIRRDGHLRIYADIPEEAPIARSFTSMLIQVFDGQPASAVRDAPSDLLDTLELKRLLGLQRIRGLTAIHRRVRLEAAQGAGYP